MAKHKVLTCLCCKWVFHTDITGSEQCPYNCGQGTDSAKKVHGDKAYAMLTSQEAWKNHQMEILKRNMAEHIDSNRRIVEEHRARTNRSTVITVNQTYRFTPPRDGSNRRF